MNFNEENTVEQLILDSCERLGWKYVAGPELPRQLVDVFVESKLRDALIRLNPEIAEQPDRADEVIYKLRAIQLSVQTDGLVRSNEAFTEWMRNEKTMPFGKNGQHTSIRLIDFENLDNNEFIVCNQWTYQVGETERRFDVILLINGLPVVAGEAKTPVRPAITWVDGASQIHDNYEQSIPGMFVPNIFNFASDGRAYRYGSIRMPLTIWGPWRLGSQGSNESATQLVRERGGYAVDKDSPMPVTDAAFESGTLADVQKAVESMLHPSVVLDLLSNFTIFATDKKHRRIKIIARYQKYEGTNLIVQRVVDGRIKKGLIWHFQGSGKSLLMVFTAQKLRLHPKLGLSLIHISEPTRPY